jgi:hypothetical protein
MNTVSKIVLVSLALVVSSIGFADTTTTVRATQLSPKIVNDLEKGVVQDLIITFQSEGDLLETNQAAPSYVVVKRPFWVRIVKNGVTISLDGLNYKKISDVLGGSFTVTASDQGAVSGTANAISVLLKAYLK